MLDTPKTGMEAVKAKTSLADLARKLKITRGAVAQWKNVPGERIGDVSRATGIPPEQLRPDLFATPSQERASA